MPTVLSAGAGAGILYTSRPLVIYPSNSLSDRSFVGDWEPAARAESVGVEGGTLVFLGGETRDLYEIGWLCGAENSF